MTVWSILFILSLLLIVYTYLGYPCSMWIASKIVRTKQEKLPGEFTPIVSILIAAYNEEEHIRSTVMNKLKLNYPADKLQIIVVSDCSSDATDQICAEIAEKEKSVTFIRQNERRGKTAALNQAVHIARGEVLVFSDANSIYRADALKHLVKNFQDTEVGYVTGHMVYLKQRGASVEEGCSSYIRYENIIRKAESNVGSVVGVNGGIDAIRKTLYEPIRADLISDFVIPLLVVKKGFRVVYEPQAVLEEYALTDSSKEFKMRVRVTTRAFHALVYMRDLFNVFKYPLFSYQLFFHKLLRYLIPELLIVLFVSNCIIYSSGLGFKIFFGMQCAFYGAAFWEYINQRNGRGNSLLYIPYYFVLINTAALKALIDYSKGKRQVTWQPRAGN